MAITATDIVYHYSIKTGAAGDTASQPDPNASLGKYVATNSPTSGTVHHLFDKLTGPENAAGAGEVEYRCIFVRNNHATLTWESVVVWLSNVVAGGADAAISVDTTAASDADSASAQAKEVVDESTAPAAQSFSAPITKGTGLSIGDLAPDQVRAIWIRRTATNSAALNNDGATLTCEGDTAA